MPAGLAAGPAIDAIPVVVPMVDVIPAGDPGPGRMAVPVVVPMVDVIPAVDPAAGPTTAPTWIGDVGGLMLQVPPPGVGWRGVEPVASDGRSTRIALNGLR